MDSEIFICAVCNNALKNVNIVTRTGYCDVCEETRVLPRKEVNTAPSVLKGTESAVRAFSDKNFELAKSSALSVLENAYDNLPAKFIEAFDKAYLAKVKSKDLLDKFFNEILNEVETDPEERDAVKKLFIKCPSYVCEYEVQILRYVSKEDPVSIAAFVETFCPATIAKKTDMDWFTKEIVDLYTDLSSRVNLPKTWYALFQHISMNPDSPERSNTFYLKTKTKRYYDTIILGVDKIFSAISDETLKQKFTSALEKKKAIFISKM